MEIIFKAGDKVVARFTPIDPVGSYKPKNGYAKGSVTKNTPSPLTVEAVKNRRGDEPLLKFEGIKGVFDSSYFRINEEVPVREVTKAQAEVS